VAGEGAGGGEGVGAVGGRVSAGACAGVSVSRGLLGRAGMQLRTGQAAPRRLAAVPRDAVPSSQRSSALLCTLGA